MCMKKRTQGEFGFVNWGGKRRGAGRKPKGERAGVSHGRRPKLSRHHPVLVTLRVAPGLRSLRAKAEHEVVLGSLSAGSAGEGFRVIEYTVQSNHLHLVVEATSHPALARGMLGLTVRLARGLNRLWQRRGKVFPDRYHARALTTPREVRNALVYTLLNGRKHDAWRAKRPDPYSSGPGFDGWREREKGAESSARLLPCARTWLLAIGWRRHGLIAYGERPSIAA
jgi:REP element-mobilizing transposase RayT